ncbi:hypothetical protein [Streptomyces sp. NPDC001401]|uniref:WXG100-like domain-containing protein n=1 Tax=Streptomyces sp. NPDC001401 TaxID=3364570 RepID=UPI0036ABCA34
MARAMSRPADGGGSGGPINLYPEDLYSVGLHFASGQDTIDSIASTLNAALQNAGGMAGNDDYGHKFGAKYDPAARTLFTALSASARAIGQASTALVTTANNFLKADHHSNAKAGGSEPDQFSPPGVFTDVTYPDPASAIGPGDSSMPDAIAKYWPNGHQDKLRAAADAYRTASTAIDTLGAGLHRHVLAITENNSDDSIDAMADFWKKIWQDGQGGGQAPLSTAKHACDELAKACDSFAQAIDDAHSQTESKMAEAGIAIGLTTAAGVLLTVFTGGGSDAAAGALDATEAAAILGDVEVTLDSAVTSISTEMIADIEISLQAAAEGVPEIEAVDAGTTEVSQVLERELAESEAREPAGVGGRGGGGGGGDEPPTGGGDDEPPADDSGDEGLPKSYEEKSKAVRDVMSDDQGNLVGEEDAKGVRMVTEEELQQTRQKLFERLGEPEIKATPKGNIEVWRLSDDPPSTVTYRPFSKSGGPTIDMNDVDGLDAKRLHIPQH